MSGDKSAVGRGYDALKALADAGSKVNKNSVAKHAGFSHTNFRKEEFADLRDAIESIVKQQEMDKISNQVEVLKKQVAELTHKLRHAQNQAKSSFGSEAPQPIELMVKLTECYRLNDQLKSENADLRNQLAHKLGSKEELINFNQKTGEVITGIFDK